MSNIKHVCCKLGGQLEYDRHVGLLLLLLLLLIIVLRRRRHRPAGRAHDQYRWP